MNILIVIKCMFLSLYLSLSSQEHDSDSDGKLYTLKYFINAKVTYYKRTFLSIFCFDHTWSTRYSVV